MTEVIEEVKEIKFNRQHCFKDDRSDEEEEDDEVEVEVDDDEMEDTTTHFIVPNTYFSQMPRERLEPGFQGPPF
jgi:hypothetical protein